MEYFTTTSNASRRAVDCVIVGIYARGKLSSGAADIDKATSGELRRLFKSGDLSAKVGDCSMLTGLDGVKAKRVAVVGLGKPSALQARQFRQAMTAAATAVFQNPLYNYYYFR